jgi:hypothetical protein
MGFLVGSHFPRKRIRSEIEQEAVATSPPLEPFGGCAGPRKIGRKRRRGHLRNRPTYRNKHPAAVALLVGAAPRQAQKKGQSGLILLVNLEVHPVPVCRNSILRLLKRHIPCADLAVKIVLDCILLPGTRSGVIGLWP